MWLSKKVQAIVPAIPEIFPDALLSFGAWKIYHTKGAISNAGVKSLDVSVIF